MPKPRPIFQKELSFLCFESQEAWKRRTRCWLPLYLQTLGALLRQRMSMPLCSSKRDTFGSNTWPQNFHARNCRWLTHAISILCAGVPSQHLHTTPLWHQATCPSFCSWQGTSQLYSKVSAWSSSSCVPWKGRSRCYQKLALLVLVVPIGNQSQSPTFFCRTNSVGLPKLPCSNL